MSYIIRPISDRTAFSGKYRLSPFKASWPETERLLLKEVGYLRGKDLVIEADLREDDIRIDGRIRANARPTTPAVRVAFGSVYGPLTYATDRFTWWQDNIRAIALGLEALRKVDRYGITRRGEQYAGWKALTAGSGASSSHMTREQGLAVFANYAGVSPDMLNTDSELQWAWRTARRESHPDRHDGDRTLWDQVEQAAAALGLL